MTNMLILGPVAVTRGCSGRAEVAPDLLERHPKVGRELTITLACRVGGGHLLLPFTNSVARVVALCALVGPL